MSIACALGRGHGDGHSGATTRLSLPRLDHGAIRCKTEYDCSDNIHLAALIAFLLRHLLHRGTQLQLCIQLHGTATPTHGHK